MKLMLDTHAMLWWVLGEGPLTNQQVGALEHAERSGDAMGVSAISLWELAKLVEKRRVTLGTSPDAAFDEIESHPAFRVLPITGRIALESTRLGPRFHSDPADQLIVATARVHGLRLVTADKRIRKSGAIATI